MNNAFQFNGRPDKPIEHAAQAKGVRAEMVANDELDYFRYEDVEDKWPAWKSTTFILGCCSAFWAFAIFLGSQIFG